MKSALPSNPWVYVASIASVMTILSACVDFDEPGEDRVLGARGYACVDDLSPEIVDQVDACASNLFCLEIEGAFVCSGPQSEGETCFVDDDCQYRRNEVGLPLFCEEGTCQYRTPTELPTP